MVMGQGETGIHLRCRVNWASPLPIIAKPNVSIDGRTATMSWGRHFLPTSPGRHEVSVSFHWRGGPDPEASATVDVAQGQQINLEFRTAVMFGFAFLSQPTLRLIDPSP
jgi:hypothetical protein